MHSNPLLIVVRLQTIKMSLSLSLSLSQDESDWHCVALLPRPAHNHHEHHPRQIRERIPTLQRRHGLRLWLGHDHVQPPAAGDHIHPPGRPVRDAGPSTAGDDLQEGAGLAQRWRRR